MPLFIRQSFIYKFLLIFFIKPYNKSVLKKNVDKCTKYLVSSRTYKKIDAYFNKKPYFLKSVSYKLFRRFISQIDKLMDYLNFVVMKFVNNSKLLKFSKNKYVLIGFSLLLLFAFGFKMGMVLVVLMILAYLVMSDYQTVIYALAMYPIIDYILRSAVPGIAGLWDELLLIGMFAVWGYKYLISRKEDNFRQTPLDAPVIIFLVAMIVVFITTTTHFNIAFEGLRAVIQYMFWYFVVIQLIKDKNGAKNVCLLFILVVSAMAIHGVLQFVIGVEMPSNWVDSNEAGIRTRVYSILTSPNIMGSLMTLALPLCLSFATISKNKIGKMLFCFFALMMTASLIFTYSRGAWIGFAGAVAIYVFFKDKRLFIPVIVFGLLAVFLVPGVGSRIAYMLSSEYIESSLRGGRLIRWLTGFEILSDNLLLGTGHGQFGGAVAMNHQTKYFIGTSYQNTYYMDNYYLKMAVETGLLGLSAFLMLMYQIMINGIRTIRITKDKESREIEIGLLSGLFGVMIHNCVENVFEVPMMTSCFWLFVAILMFYWFNNYKRVSKRRPKLKNN